MQFPFEVPYADVAARLDEFADAIIASLESDFIVMPKGDGFIPFPIFEDAYEALKKATRGFRDIKPAALLPVVATAPVTLIVLRAMLGFTPSEWAHVTTKDGTAVTQGQARAIDRKVRMAPTRPLKEDGATWGRIRAMVDCACRLLIGGAPVVPADRLHRLDKVDTKTGGPWMPSLADTGVSYAMLLYERFLGRPFAGHRDSVSDLVGDSLESAIEDVLTGAGVSFRKTKRAEKVPGFDQAPDFIIPSAENPHVVIEAKITEDDGTARDKVTRVLRLCTNSEQGMPAGERRYQVIACIAGRGFKQRREDMKRLIVGTRGLVFTPSIMQHLVQCSDLRSYATKR